MNTLKRTVLVILGFALLIAADSLLGQYERPGSASAQFLKMSVTPRGAAMGNAQIAISRGAEAIFYNPAALATFQGTDVSLAHTEWFANINHDYLGITHNFGRLGAFGASVTSFTTDMMKVRTPLQPEGTGETFQVSNFRAGLTYARNLTDRVSFGANLNFIRLGLYDKFKVNAYSADISVLYRAPFRGFQFGMKIANFGSSVTFVNEQYPLPQNFTFGMAINAYEATNSKLVATGSAMKPNDGQTLLRGGLEWDYGELIYLRGGYQFNHDIATYSLGSGLRFSIGGYAMTFDYAYNAYGKLGGAQRFGVNLSF